MLPLDAFPTWVTVALGLLFVAAGIAAGEPLVVVLGPLFMVLGGIRYAMAWSEQNRALRAEHDAPLGPPVKRDPAFEDDPGDTYRVRENRGATIAAGVFFALIGCGA
ncbi:MAG: hypothetical protein M3Y34_02680, partial [Actinomycetota bacterium]|nr:hypothetical protein [Actinomycetota bacterium]